MNEITEEFRIHFSYNDKTGEIKRITRAMQYLLELVRIKNITSLEDLIY